MKGHWERVCLPMQAAETCRAGLVTPGNALGCTMELERALKIASNTNRSSSLAQSKKSLRTASSQFSFAYANRREVDCKQLEVRRLGGEEERAGTFHGQAASAVPFICFWERLVPRGQAARPPLARSVPCPRHSAGDEPHPRPAFPGLG